MLAANYFNYFTEVEDHYCRRRGTHLQISTLDWALIETWKDAGIPLEAVLRGIDEAFDRYDQRKSKSRKVNSLAYCAQAVLGAAEDMKEAAVGTNRASAEAPGLDGAAVAAYLRRNVDDLRSRTDSLPAGAQAVARNAAASLTAAVADVEQRTAPSLEDLERLLTVLEEKLLAALLAAAADAELLAIRGDADRDLAPYRRNLTADQIERLYRQYAHKRLLERYGLPRLSLFYM
jgi:hypothetical protein